jgi:glycosyltransferase involved in cell wall biosynthesis
MRNSNGVIPKNIIMLGSFPPLRAISSYCMALSLSLSELCPVEFISFRKIYPSFLYPGGDLTDDETYPPINCPNLKIRRRLTWYNPLTWMIEGLSVRGDILHAQWWTTFLGLIYLIIFIEFKLRRRPVIITVHNIQSHEKTRLDQYVSGLLFKLCDHFIVHSSSNERQLIEYFNIPDDKISIIPHGPLSFQVQGDIDRLKVRDEFGFKPQDKVLLFFGTIRPYKGIDTALNAFKEVVKQVPDARLLIAGKLWESWDRYEKIISDLNISGYIKKHLRYIPAEEVGRFFIASDLVILPYHHFDSQSGVGAAALAFHKPMIVTDTGGLSEFVTDRFYVVPQKDSAALSEKIISCLIDPLRLAKMSEGSARIALEISWHSIALKTLSVYRNVILTKSLGKKKK